MTDYIQTIQNGSVVMNKKRYYIVDGSADHPYTGQLDGMRFSCYVYEECPPEDCYHGGIWGTEAMALALQDDEAYDREYQKQPKNFLHWEWLSLHPLELCKLANTTDNIFLAHRVRWMLTDYKNYPLQLKLAPWLADYNYDPGVEYFVNYSEYQGTKEHNCTA